MNFSGKDSFIAVEQGDAGMGDPDVILMSRCRDGDMSAFDELVHRHKRPLVNFFYKFFWDHHMAEDCSQEVFCRLFKSAAGYRPEATFKVFLYSIARHYLYDQLRRIRRMPQLVSLDQPLSALSEDDCGALDMHERIPDEKSNPHKHLELKEITRLIKEAVLSLPAAHREVFVLCQDQGLKYEEAAGVLNIPVGTVKSRMYKAASLLRESFRELKEK